MTLPNILLSSCIVLLVVGCQSVELNQSLPFDQVEEELWVYFESFEQEALARGISINLNDLDLSGEVESITQEGVAGSCQYGSHITNHITIDQEFWNNASDNHREYVVYHELGHCVLLRDHDESTDTDGNCLSVMASGTGDCVARYGPANRDQMLDELFLSDD